MNISMENIQRSKSMFIDTPQDFIKKLPKNTKLDSLPYDFYQNILNLENTLLLQTKIETIESLTTLYAMGIEFYHGSPFQKNFEIKLQELLMDKSHMKLMEKSTRNQNIKRKPSFKDNIGGLENHLRRNSCAYKNVKGLVEDKKLEIKDIREKLTETNSKSFIISEEANYNVLVSSYLDSFNENMICGRNRIESDINQQEQNFRRRRSQKKNKNELPLSAKKSKSKNKNSAKIVNIKSINSSTDYESSTEAKVSPKKRTRNISEHILPPEQRKSSLNNQLKRNSKPTDFFDTFIERFRSDFAMINVEKNFNIIKNILRDEYTEKTEIYNDFENQIYDTQNLKKDLDETYSVLLSNKINELSKEKDESVEDVQIKANEKIFKMMKEMQENANKDIKNDYESHCHDFLSNIFKILN